MTAVLEEAVPPCLNTKPPRGKWLNAHPAAVKTTLLLIFKPVLAGRLPGSPFVTIAAASPAYIIRPRRCRICTGRLRPGLCRHGSTKRFAVFYKLDSSRTSQSIAQPQRQVYALSSSVDDATVTWQSLSVETEAQSVPLSGDGTWYQLELLWKRQF